MNKYYAVLGLPATASKDEIRRKYRQLVLLWHPDRNSSPEAQGKFIAITEAYDILMGERPAPRVKTGYSWPKQQPAPRPSQAPRTTKAELMRKKFEKIRSEHRAARDSMQLKFNMQSKSRRFFAYTAITGAMIFVIPFVCGTLGHLIWTLPIGVGLGAQFLWRAGRYKLRSDMIFGTRDRFSDAEIAEFFVERPGFGNNSSTDGNSNNYW